LLDSHLHGNDDSLSFDFLLLNFEFATEGSTVCLAIPALIKEINGTQAIADIEGVTREISLELTPDAKTGDYVLLHTGYAISIIDAAEAEETLELLREMTNS
jgi:hydrogenase expression/formation protein HypC